MMFKRLAIFLTAITLIFAGTYSHSPASAAVNYTFSYNQLNRYNTEQITYTFSNLIATETYAWSVFTVSTVDGTLLTNFGTFTSTPDDRSGSPTDEVFTFGGVDFSTPLGTIVYPQGYSGPIAVTDSNGTILGRHFIAELPTFITTPTSDWFDNGVGNTTVGERQATGPTTFQGPCRNVIYNEMNSDGWLHSFIPCSVTTLDGGWTLLHYQITSTYDPTMDDHTINFFLIPDAVIEFTVSLNELIDYQYTGTYTPGADFNFVVLNTSGRFLSFLDNTRCANAFTSGQNPCLSDFDPGVYNYSRNNGGWISDGESVMIVTDDPTGFEWTLTPNVDSVGESGTQTLVARAVTPEVWDSYHGFQQVADVSAGYSDTTVYAFSTARNHSYTVAAGVATDVTAQWINRAAAINSGLATPTEMEFEVQAFYDIVDIRTFEENVNEVLNNTGLNTDAGRAALLTIILFVGMLGTAAFPGIRSNIFAYLVVWTGLGSVYILGGFGTLLVNTVFIILTIVMWLFAIMMLQTGWENETD